MGTEISPEAIEVFAYDLSHLPDADIKRGLERCRREVKGTGGFAPRLILQDVLERAGDVTEGDAKQLEAECAWDVLMVLVEKFARRSECDEVVLRRSVGKPSPECSKCHGEGMFFVVEGGAQKVSRCDCRVIVEVPDIETRTAAVVRSMGGWGTFKDIPTKSFPFVKRDFLAEYGKQEKTEKYKLLQLDATQQPGTQLTAGTDTPHRLDGMLSHILSSDVR
jgi:hypothetical protein